MRGKLWVRPETFAQRLKRIIKERNVTLREIEENGVCHSNSITRYLSGETMPNAFILQKLCAYFGVSCDWLLGLSDEKNLKGKWVFIDGECRCSKCNCIGETIFRWCPNCGERMNVEI